MPNKHDKYFSKLAGEVENDDSRKYAGVKGKSGYVAVIGRPNVGKSTLMNRILGQKISIVTAKPQTTRHQILGIYTGESGQIVFIDTPGLHGGQNKALNRYMNRTAQAAVSNVDAVLFLTEALRWTGDDAQALKALRGISEPVFLVINKVDKVTHKEKLLPFVQSISQKHPFDRVFLVSAVKGDGIRDILSALYDALPVGEPIFSADEVTDKSVRYLAAELIREKLMRRFHQEVPYSIAVEIESWKEDDEISHIHAVIWVERDSQKAMLVGKDGEALKQTGIQARRDIEDLLEKRINLKLWVKVKKSWADSDSLIQKMGYKDSL